MTVTRLTRTVTEEDSSSEYAHVPDVSTHMCTHTHKYTHTHTHIHWHTATYRLTTTMCLMSVSTI
jgi:hypothetical protein